MNCLKVKATFAPVENSRKREQVDQIYPVYSPSAGKSQKWSTCKTQFTHPRHRPFIENKDLHTDKQVSHQWSINSEIDPFHAHIRTHTHLHIDIKVLDRKSLCALVQFVPHYLHVGMRMFENLGWFLFNISSFKKKKKVSSSHFVRSP